MLGSWREPRELGSRLTATLSWCVAALLALVAGRRFWLIAGAFRRDVPSSPQTLPHVLPEILILAAMRNECERAHQLLTALDQVNYPADRLRIVLGDDASEDHTLDMLTAWAAGRTHVMVLSGDTPLGKAERLNRLLESSGSGAPFIAVYDAKHGPASDSLWRLVGGMENESTGCLCGYLEPKNARASLVSRYAALESWVTQLVHHEGKENQGLSSPSLGGNCMYRRTALEQVGGFPAGALSEDTELSLAMQALGWRTRFLRRARATNLVVDSLGDFWRQRLRWSAGLAAAQRKARGPFRWAMILGYGDRLLLLVAVGLAVLDWLPWWVLLLYLAAPLAMVAAAILRAGALRDGPKMVVAILLLFPVDIAVTAVSVFSGWGTRRSVFWR